MVCWGFIVLILMVWAIAATFKSNTLRIKVVAVSSCFLYPISSLAWYWEEEGAFWVCQLMVICALLWLYILDSKLPPKGGGGLPEKYAEYEKQYNEYYKNKNKASGSEPEKGEGPASPEPESWEGRSESKSEFKPSKKSGKKVE